MTARADLTVSIVSYHVADELRGALVSIVVSARAIALRSSS